MFHKFIISYRQQKTHIDCGFFKLRRRDPKLKEAAFQAGLKEKNLWTVEGSLELEKLHQAAAEVNVKLFQAAVDGKELSAEEKAQAVKSIVKAQVATQSMLLDNTKSQGAKYDKYFADFINGEMPPGDKNNPRKSDYYQENGELNMPKKGVPYVTSGMHMTESMKRYYKEKPVSVMLLKTQTGQKNLDTIADQIIAEDKLLNLPTKDLANKLDFAASQSSTSYGKRSIRMMAEQGMVTNNTMQDLQQELKTGVAVMKQQQPKNPAPAPQAENSIKKRAKMFEGNQPGIR